MKIKIISTDDNALIFIRCYIYNKSYHDNGLADYLNIDHLQYFNEAKKYGGTDCSIVNHDIITLNFYFNCKSECKNFIENFLLHEVVK